MEEVHDGNEGWDNTIELQIRDGVMPCHATNYSSDDEDGITPSFDPIL
jgi:hypothetical protein